MTDAAFLLSVLEDGEPHSTNEILAQSISERGCGLMVHSRAADLRKRGHYITCDRVGKQNGRPVYEYRLLGSIAESEPNAALLDSTAPAEASTSVTTSGLLPEASSDSELCVPEQLRLSEVA